MSKLMISSHQPKASLIPYINNMVFPAIGDTIYFDREYEGESMLATIGHNGMLGMQFETPVETESWL